MMTLEPLIINTALSRAPNSEVTLAAYNVMFSIALVIEAPVIMLVSASAALSQTQYAFSRLFRFMLLLGGAVVVIGFVFSLTPLYDLVVLDLMGIPVAVAEAARPAMVIMSIWSFPVAWRRTLQGVLIANNKTPIITLATLVRLGALAGALAIGGRLMPENMLVVSAWAMQVSVIAESIVVTGPAFASVRQLAPGSVEESITWRDLIRFYQPLVVTMILRQITRPLLSAGIAAALQPQRSLAAWSVAWSLVLVPLGATMGLEQVVITKDRTSASQIKVRRFVHGIGLALSTVLVLIAFTPLFLPTLELLFDLTPEMVPLVSVALRGIVLLPFIQSAQAVFRGRAIRQARTPDVRSAVAIALASVVLIILVGPRLDQWNGVIIGVLATILSALAEIGWLAWRERKTEPPQLS